MRRWRNLIRSGEIREKSRSVCEENQPVTGWKKSELMTIGKLSVILLLERVNFRGTADFLCEHGHRATEKKFMVERPCLELRFLCSSGFCSVRKMTVPISIFSAVFHYHAQCDGREFPIAFCRHDKQRS